MLSSFSNGLEKWMFFRGKGQYKRIIHSVQFSGLNAIRTVHEGQAAMPGPFLHTVRSSRSCQYYAMHMNRAAPGAGDLLIGLYQPSAWPIQPPPPGAVSSWWLAEWQHPLGVQWHHLELYSLVADAPALSGLYTATFACASHSSGVKVHSIFH